MMEQLISQQIRQAFVHLFGSEPILVRSPGRVNIIGEHTDYNNGFVLPAAISKAIYIAVGKRKDNIISLHSLEFGKNFEVSLESIKPTELSWPNYILGVTDQLLTRGFNLTGFNLVIGGDVPIGSGLSSSAAVECATAFSLNILFDCNLSKMDLVLMAQKAEHQFAGVRVGIMDMFASVFGKKDHVIKLDCRSYDFEYVPMKLKGIRILLLNTNVKHSLASTEYNNRRKECEAGVELVKNHNSEVESLRDVTLEKLEQFVKPADNVIYKRCRYVVEENERLLSACEDLKNGNLDELGKKMFLSHEGLSRQYEVSCRELDFLVEAVRNNPAVLGARMMGGGFGGCTINLVHENAIEEMVYELGILYKDQMGLELSSYVAEIEDGTAIINNP